MEDIIISTTKLSDLLPLIIIAFILSIVAFGCIAVFYCCDYSTLKQNANDIEELKKELKIMKKYINANSCSIEYKASISYVDDCFERIKRINKRLNRLKPPLCADEKKKSE